MVEEIEEADKQNLQQRPSMLESARLRYVCVHQLKIIELIESLYDADAYFLSVYGKKHERLGANNLVKYTGCFFYLETGSTLYLDFILRSILTIE